MQAGSVATVAVDETVVGTVDTEAAMSIYQIFFFY